MKKTLVGLIFATTLNMASATNKVEGLNEEIVQYATEGLSLKIPKNCSKEHYIKLDKAEYKIILTCKGKEKSFHTYQLLHKESLETGVEVWDYLGKFE